MMAVVAECWLEDGWRRIRMEMLGRVGFLTFILSCGAETIIEGWVLWRGWLDGGVGEARDTVKEGSTSCTLTRVQPAVAGSNG